MKNRSSKAAKMREFSQKAREEIFLRDFGQCIFCRQQYCMDDKNATWLGKEILSVMHYIPRSANGLGIPKNGALGCQYHHEMMDNGNKGRREEMLRMFREYLRSKYADWNEAELYYSKWEVRK